MKLHEYQAKDLLRKYRIPVPEGRIAATPEEALQASHNLKGPPWAVKAQVHAGGRGKGGGVRIVHSREELQEAAEAVLSRPLVTKQTGPGGRPVHQVLVEEGVAVAREFYLAMVVDRSRAEPVMIFSPEGGTDIEEVAERSPDLILKEFVDPARGWMPYQGRNLVYGLSPLPAPEALKAILDIMAGLHTLFQEADCSLAEINPLAITRNGRVLALDAKCTVDDNALFRQKDLAALEDPREKDPLEVKADHYGLNYIRLDGNIGAMVNGAGLAMASMDMIQRAGGEPANFLDVGGGASEEMITRGFEIILEDPKVRAVLITIFGGILRCDVLARGLLAAAEKTEIRVPLIVRLEGTNVEEGRRILEGSSLTFHVARDMSEAAAFVTRQVKGGEDS